ncbi:MAG: MFS transporter [Micrococcales bacterium]|nr:MFS transporter [Micrococcales bacterium]
MMATGLIAIDSTILATAVPSVVADLGGFSQFPWLFSVYLLAQAASVPVYGKLADTVGRKPMILVGIGLFLLGSILCALAWSLPALIVFRAVQGLGAGAILPMSITIVGDIYTVQERAKIQGYIASVWAVSAVVGPTLGGVFAQLEAWRFIFWVNVPLCILAAVLLLRVFHERLEPRRHRIDYLGAVLLTAASTLLILGALEGGQAWAWDAWQSIGAFTLGAVLLVLFLLVERRAAEPILPLWVFGRRLLLTTNVISIGVGAMLIGLTSYVPTYLQNTVGASPIVAGLALAALTIGWPLSAAFRGRLYLRRGFRVCVLVGSGIALAGAVGLAVSTPYPSVWLVAVSSFVVGLGLGLVAAPSLIAAQSSVEWSERGVVTGANLFGRSLGSAVGIAVLGAVANAVLAGRPETDAAGITAASGAVFWASAIAGIVIVVFAIAMPAVRARTSSASAATTEPTETVPASIHRGQHLA